MRKKLVMAVLAAVAAAVTVFVGQQVYSAGYNAGLDEGHAGWYDKGYSEGSEDGYDRGFAAGASSMSTGLSTAELMVSTEQRAPSTAKHSLSGLLSTRTSKLRRTMSTSTVLCSTKIQSAFISRIAAALQR